MQITQLPLAAIIGCLIAVINDEPNSLTHASLPQPRNAEMCGENESIISESDSLGVSARLKYSFPRGFAAFYHALEFCIRYCVCHELMIMSKGVGWCRGVGVGWRYLSRLCVCYNHGRGLVMFGCLPDSIGYSRVASDVTPWFLPALHKGQLTLHSGPNYPHVCVV